MSTEQRENLDAILRQSAFPADLDVSELRRLLAELTSAQPLPADVTVTAAALGGVPTAEIALLGTVAWTAVADSIRTQVAHAAAGRPLPKPGTTPPAGRLGARAGDGPTAALAR